MHNFVNLPEWASGLSVRFLGSLFGFVSLEHLCLLASGLLVCFVLLSALFLH